VSRTRVLIVDDSALIRQLLTRILSSDPQLEVVGAAPDPYRAWDLIQRAQPDVLTLDVEMPRMDGLAFLERLMRARPMPVVMVSSLTEVGCETTLRALELGAIDFVTKPKIDVRQGVEELAADLVARVKAAARSRPRSPRKVAAAAAAPRVAGALIKSTEVVLAIGASTGGTEALRVVLQAMPADAPGIVIVQHMPEKFTRHFADRLDGLCAIRVREAQDGDRILPGQALIAPGGAAHMEVVRSGAQYHVRLVPGPPVGHHRPAVDVLFHSCARVLGSNAVAGILTGMGGDGAQGMLAMRRAGARTVAEDESTCVVFGMPKEAIAAGAVDVVAPLEAVADTMLRLVGGSAARVSLPPRNSIAPRKPNIGSMPPRDGLGAARRGLR